MTIQTITGESIHFLLCYLSEYTTNWLFNIIPSTYFFFEVCGLLMKTVSTFPDTKVTMGYGNVMAVVLLVIICSMETAQHSIIFSSVCWCNVLLKYA